MEKTIVYESIDGTGYGKLNLTVQLKKARALALAFFFSS